MNQLHKIKDLFNWMEKHLRKTADFTVDEVTFYFAKKFTIKTNGRIVHANPVIYREYLYRLKSTLNEVSYQVEEWIEAPDIVVSIFIIRMNFNDKKAQELRAISIFKFNRQNQIVEWQEIFTNANQDKFSYDPQ